MTAITKKKSPLFPDVPRGIQAVKKDGSFTPIWHLAFSSLYQALQKNFSNEGIQIPQLSTSDLNSILAIYTALIGKKLPSNVPNISGKKVFDYTAEAEKTFIINFTTPGDVSTPITAVAWKTVQLV